MPNKFSLLILLETLGIVVFWVLLCTFVFHAPGTKEVDGIKIRKKSVYSYLSKSQMVTMIIATVAITYLLSAIHSKTYTTVILFITISAVAPYVIVNNMRRTEAEKLFSDIIVYCQNMALLLRQTHDPYTSLTSVAKDVDNSELKNDILAIAQSFLKPKETAIEVMSIVEAKYPYTIIRTLDTILVYMFYESSRFQDDLLNLYSDDVQELQKAMRKNQTKRRTLRIQYIGINVGCIITYTLFLTSLKDALGSGLNTGFFAVLNTGFLTLMVISLFMIDSYFCSHMTTE